MLLLPHLSPSLIGRDRELANLQRELDTALAGRGGLSLIGGEAGIGKTALAETLCRAAADGGGLVLVGRCYDLSETPPYGPWVELFDRLRQMSDRPHGAIPPVPPAFAEDGAVGRVESPGILFRQTREFFTALARQSALVLLFDDLHWADPASLDLLRSLARAVDALPICIIATYRSDELTPQHPLYNLLPALVREASAARVHLQRLRDNDVRELVTGRYQLAQADSIRLLAYLQRRAEGNPFFINELLRSFEETGTLRRECEAWALADLRKATVPPLLRQVIDARLRRLDAEIQRFLAVAAIIGHEASLTICAAVAERDEATVLTCVERAEEAHLIVAVPDGMHIRFAHALVREAVYEGVQPTRRRRLHRAVAEALLTTSNPDPDAVAYHFRQAGDARAVEWLIRAADRAMRAYALLDAGDRYETALALQGQSGADLGQRGWLLYRVARARRFVTPQQGVRQLDEALGIAVAVGDRVLASRALSQRGQLNVFWGAFAQGIADLIMGIERTDGLSESDPTEVTPKTVESPWSEVGSLTVHLAHAGRFSESLAVGNRFATQREIDGAHGNMDSAAGYFGLAGAYTMTGQMTDAERMFTMAHAIYRGIDHHYIHSLCSFIELRWYWLSYRADNIGQGRRLAQETEVLLRQASGAGFAAPSRFARAPLFLVEGRWSEAHADALAVITEPTIIAMWRQNATAILAPIAAARGDCELAWSLIDGVLPSGPTTPPGDCFFPTGIVMQALAAALTIAAGNLAAARAWLEARDRWMAWSGAVVGRAEGMLEWASHHRAAGDVASAYRYARQALTDATEPRQPLAQLAAHRLLGELATDAGRHADAADHLDAALALADACAAPYERALTLLAMAELAVAIGDRTRSRKLLGESHAICASLGAAPALARADALLARLGNRSEGRSIHLDRLSAREIDVLRLIACGMSNREIAGALSISSRTVNRHIENLYRKIDARNRAEATVYALRHDLT